MKVGFLHISVTFQKARTELTSNSHTDLIAAIKSRPLGILPIAVLALYQPFAQFWAARYENGAKGYTSHTGVDSVNIFH